jgi:hypothetical protein
MICTIRWGSVASSVIVTLPRGGGASDTGESPWRQLQERAQKIQGDKKHIEGMLSQSPCVAQFNTGHNPLSSGCEVLVCGKRVKFSLWLRRSRFISSRLG